MKLGVIVPCWKRPRLTALTLERIAREADEDTILVAVTDEPGTIRAAHRVGFETVEVPNKPLAAKKNAGVAHLQGRVDGAVLIGSDDWPTGDGGVPFFDCYRQQLERAQAFGPLDIWYVDLQTGRGLYSPGYRDRRRSGEPIGVGRAFRKDALDQLGWQLWPSDRQRFFDGAQRSRLEAHGVDICTPSRTQADLGVRIVDVKNDVSITPFRRVLLAGRGKKRVPWSEVLAPFPRDEVEALEALL